MPSSRPTSRPSAASGRKGRDTRSSYGRGENDEALRKKSGGPRDGEDRQSLRSNRSGDLLGFVVDLQRDLLELVRVLLAVVRAEEELEPAGHGDTDVRL